MQSCVHNLENDSQQISYCGGLESAATRASDGGDIHAGWDASLRNSVPKGQIQGRPSRSYSPEVAVAIKSSRLNLTSSKGLVNCQGEGLEMSGEMCSRHVFG